jgi:hypothetical protein
MTSRFAAAVGVALALATWARVGGAEPPSFEVPSECGSELEFRAELGELVGADAPRAMPAFVRIVREASSGDYRLTLEVGGRARELTHADCRVLFRSAAVIAAASVRADSAAGASAVPAASVPPPLVSPPRPISPSPVASPPSRPPPHERRPSALRPELGLGVGAAAGVVPGVAGTFEIRGGVATDKLGLTLGVRYFPARSVDVQGRGAEIQGFGLRLAGVVKPLPALAASLGLDADWLFGRGDAGIAVPGADSAWTLAPSAELAVIPLRTERLALELAAEGRLALIRPTFEVTGFRDLYQVPPWGGALLVRGAWRFP